MSTLQDGMGVRVEAGSGTTSGKTQCAQPYNTKQILPAPTRIESRPENLDVCMSTRLVDFKWPHFPLI